MQHEERFRAVLRRMLSTPLPPKRLNGKARIKQTISAHDRKLPSGRVVRVLPR